MKISQDRKLGFNDVYIIPRKSTIKSRSEISLEKTFYFYHSPRSLTCVPIFCSNMASVAGVKMATALKEYKYLTALHKYLSLEEIYLATRDTNLVFMSIGMNDIEKLKSYISTYSNYPNICIDVPNGYLQCFIDFCKNVRDLCPEAIIMAGNVVTPDLVQELIIYGKVDIVKLGIGPGANCITSKVTGISYPQLSCALECSIVAHGLKSADKRLGLVCLDGGFKEIGDLAKGFCSGADFCMSGGMFAGTDECCGEWKTKQSVGILPYYYDTSLPEGSLTNKSNDSIGGIAKIVTHERQLIHYGMSSHYSQEKHEGIQKDYRASEGIVTYIDAKGPVSKTVQEINGGLRSTGSFIGARNIRDFNKCGSFIQI